MVDVGYTLKRSTRARTLRIAIRPDGEVVVTAPKFFGISAVERFVGKHSEWIQKHVVRARKRTVIYVNRKEIPILKIHAAALAAVRLVHFNKLYGFKYGTISIRAQKSRWGSCSQKGNLSFNYKIAILPPHLIDYIIVHELCHLRELNHSKRFWDLVARSVPNHTALRKELRNIVTIFR